MSELGPTSFTNGRYLDPVFRDQMDARRSMWRRTPEGEYPDGYLGTITARRDDKILKAVQGQLNRKVYDRGVHKGERIDVDDYFWPPEQDPMRGLQAVAVGMRQAPLQTAVERILCNDGKSIPYDNAALPILDPTRASKMGHLRPRWR